MFTSLGRRSGPHSPSNTALHNTGYDLSEHTSAIERQSQSRLMTLPREIRNKIWQEVRREIIIHVSENQHHYQPRRKRQRRSRLAPKFLFHVCSSPRGLASSACSSHADHSDCFTREPSTASHLSRVCKAIYMENQDTTTDEISFYSQNAFQFEDLYTANEYLFALQEVQRASITHLRLDLPFLQPDSWAEGRDNSSTQESDVDVYQSSHDSLATWKGICNYFSCPWDRNTLDMGPDNQHAMAHLGSQVYFYYSDCYYAHNAHRLGHRWQVGIGNTSWDIGISDVRSKAEPRIDLALEYTRGGDDADSSSHAEQQLEDLIQAISPDPETQEPGAMPTWLRSLCQFQQYRDLAVQFYQRPAAAGKEGAMLAETVRTELMDRFGEALKGRLAEPVIGPQKCVRFRDY
ncbi:hypothetical protein PVAG01_09998 [Phlyctema vagabunda]|uniref:DUF7730 domain-containing protein n=1 Tax=Phlyctema vagabunda TaxID=108571 RepID=A0ABR4P525_9HELO